MSTIATIKVKPEVFSILDECEVRLDLGLNQEILVLPERQLDRKLYVEVAKIIETGGGKWDRKAKGFRFDGRPAGYAKSFLSATLITGEAVDEKKKYQFYETPEHLARKLVEWANVMYGDVVLEPSAGKGAIAREVRKETDFICTCELHEERAEKLLLDAFEVIERDFLKLPTWQKFDRIVANPPFTAGQDAKHFLKMVKHLKPGGRLVCVMPNGIKSKATQAAKEIQNMVGLYGHWIDLPEGTFKESGTMVNATVAIIDRPDAY